MIRLLKGLFFALLFLIFASPTFAAGSCEAPRPESAQLSKLINDAQARGGAAANVPDSVLKAIYLIEGATAYTNPSGYTCPPNPYGALGLMQIKEGEYKTITPDKEEMKDIGACAATDCQLSRCNPSDAMELAARLLLYKIGLWDASANKPLGKITTKEDVYYAAGRYYGDFTSNIGLTLLLSPSQTPSSNTITYAEFVCAYSGYCKSASDYPARTDKQYSGKESSVKFTFNACAAETIPVTDFNTHPLRPAPKNVTGGQAPLTPYCVMRPIAVEQNRLNRRDPLIDLITVGSLTQDFSSFITPLLSITDPKKPDYALPYNEKAQRYLADFLEGRAYYEPQAEINQPNFSQSVDIFNRLGVFRKLAPASYQNELKRALIERATRNPSASDDVLGFPAAAEKIHNYIVGYWDNSTQKVVDQGKGQAVTLKDFVGNWAPLPEDSGSASIYQAAAYALAYSEWKTRDSGKWYQLWPYVPMFTREDSKGRIDIIDSNPPPAPLFSGSGYEEQNQSDTSSVDVTHPHLARAYEVSTTLSYLLTPQNVHETATTPELKEEWMPRLWEDNIMWLDPSYYRPTTAGLGVEVGPVCDVDPAKINPITTSGDLAYDSSFSTSVNRKDLKVPNPQFDPEAAMQVTDECGTHDACIECKSRYIRRIDPNTGIATVNIGYVQDDSPCFYYKNVSSSPDYLISYTPYLKEILTSLSGSDRAIFDLFKPAGTEPEPYEEYSWPGTGNEGEESPVYDYSADSGEHSRAEAGGRKPGDSQGYWYRYLGSIQCAKEKVLQVLQPFVTGQSYAPYAYECFPELTPPSGIGNLPSGPKWLQWPNKNVRSVFQCFRDTRSGGTHAGIDIDEVPANGAIYPAAVGVVADVGFDGRVFGHYVIIRHDNGWSTIYAHLQPNIKVNSGDKVTSLDKPLGYQDNTGAASEGDHLHFGLSKGSSFSDFYYLNTPIADPCAAMEGCSCQYTGN
jgi:hypothetical protein